MSCSTRFKSRHGASPPQTYRLQLLTVQDFTYNAFSKKNLRANSRYLHENKEPWGRGVCHASQTRNGKRNMLGTRNCR